MIRIQVELWLGLGKELGGDFQSPSEMRSIIEIDVEDGMTVKKLFSHLADRYPPIGEKIFNRGNESFYPNLNVIVTFNDRVISPHNVEDRILKDGDKIMVLPLYAGG